MQLFKKGRVWYFSQYLAGRRIRKSTGETDKASAREIAEAWVARQRQTLSGDVKQLITFGECVALYLDQNKSPRYLLPLMNRLENVRVADITPQMLRRVAIELYPAHCAATRNRQAIVPAQAVINHAADLGFANAIRVKRFPVETRERQAGDWQWIDAFAKAATAHDRPQLAALAIFMFTTGARISQALAVRWADIDLQGATVWIPRTMKPGDKRRRQASLVPEALAAIANLPLDPLSGRLPHGKLFGYASRHTVQKQWRKTCERAGIAHLTPHEAGRHGFGTQMIVRARVDAVTAAAAGGWSSPRVLTETYAHSGRTEAAVKDAFRRK